LSKVRLAKRTLCVRHTRKGNIQEDKGICGEEEVPKIYDNSEGLTGDELEKVAKSLKSMLACGGTYKNGVIELQGMHKDEVKKALIKLGYPEDSIDVA